jgi:uncharacterized membrane protein YqjE
VVFAMVERSIASLLRDIIGNVQQIIRAEVRLAKVEVAEELGKARRAAIILAVGALFAVFAVAFLLLGAVYLLSQVVQPWLASVIVALARAGVGGALLIVGARQLKLVSLAPERTVNSVQENIQWAKAQAR